MYIVMAWVSINTKKNPGGVTVMVFNTTFNNISVKSWQSVLLVEETGVPVENHDLPQVNDKHYHTMLYWVNIAQVGIELTTLVVIGTDCTGSCKSNYHTIMTTTAPWQSILQETFQTSLQSNGSVAIHKNNL